jgi:hypothetical protein
MYSDVLNVIHSCLGVIKEDREYIVHPIVERFIPINILRKINEYYLFRWRNQGFTHMYV